jgi:hypothetical protein
MRARSNAGKNTEKDALKDETIFHPWMKDETVFQETVFHPG